LKFRVDLHVVDRHASSAKFDQEIDPANILFGIAAVGILSPVDRVNEADPFIIPQRVNTQTSRLGHLFDCIFSVHPVGLPPASFL
jgi:hypothetical protein